MSKTKKKGGKKGHTLITCSHPKHKKRYEFSQKSTYHQHMKTWHPEEVPKEVKERSKEVHLSFSDKETQWGKR